MHRLLLGIAASTLMVTGAMAADLNAAPAPAYNSAAFDWSGFYMGLGGGVEVDTFGPPLYPFVTGEVGYNYVLDNNVVIGGELSGLLYIDGSGDTALYATGRLGMVASDNVLIYGLAGVGTYNFSLPLYIFGGGIEVAVTDNMTFRGELKFDDAFGFVPPAYVMADASVLWHL